MTATVMENLQKARTKGDDKAILQALLAVGQEAYTSEDWHLVQKTFLEALDMAQSQKAYEAENTSLRFLGIVEMKQGDDINEAVIYFEQAVEVSRKLDLAEQVRALNNLGYILNFVGRFTHAQLMLEEARRLSQQVDGSTVFAHLFSNLGFAYMAQGAFHQAFKDWQRGLYYAQQYDETVVILTIITNMAHIAIAKDEARFASRWTGFALSHPDCTSEVEERAQLVVDDILFRVGDSIMAQYRQDGANVDLTTILTEISTFGSELT